MGQPMMETAFLADINRWAMEGVTSYIAETNRNIALHAAHGNSAADIHEVNDQDGSQRFNKINDRHLQA